MEKRRKKKGVVIGEKKIGIMIRCRAVRCVEKNVHCAMYEFIRTLYFLFVHGLQRE